ncbi:phosphopantothenoylcysteine decarboxylase [Verrucomicrobiales bacterium]|nr:phosphopantothenoylcysteine decarboxylase [Verrucomicrobiales bacterium]RZO18745.1 MAG: phosphopantothenoylcysteine decarboxylase [Verrucomicrobiaceae bacterium]
MRILITAGPTREPIDPVRFLSNRSTGKMGYAIATAAELRGHDVTLVSGPVNVPNPGGCHIISVETASQMHDEVMEHSKGCDAAVMVAAVADYTPLETSPHKLKKSGDKDIKLKRTKDVLGSMRQIFGFDGVLVGFAADTEELRENALSKMKRKGCDFIVANDVSRKDIGFESDYNEVTIFQSDGSKEHIKKCSKQKIAEKILDKIESLLKG